ncbi:MAG: T9SS C-terminal target domain-containing protein [Flavobacteriia bacterium]
MLKLKYFFFIILAVFLNKFHAQSFAPAPGNLGTTAIHKDSSIILSWAIGIDLQRGYLNISDKTLGNASYGLPENALFQVEGNSFDIVSFGDSGVAVLTFENPIMNGEGFDFAVFENGFADDYIEYAFVEVSSDGIHFVRFPAISETPTITQMGNFEYSDCRYVNNLAGKYRQGYGTPFDLEELKDSANLDVNNITHVKIIDVIGSINAQYGSLDALGNIINDPWPSDFESGGFDLDGIGVMYSNINSLIEKENLTKIYYLENEIKILSEKQFTYSIFSLDGKIIETNIKKSTDLSLEKKNLHSVYFLKLNFDSGSQLIKLFF